MENLKRTLSLLKKNFLSIVLFLVVYILVVFLLSKITVNSDAENQSKEIAIYLRTNGVHTDLVLPKKTKSKIGASKFRSKIQLQKIQLPIF